VKLPAPQPGLVGVFRPTICIDFDATLVEWGSLMGPTTLKPGAADAVRSLADAGYRIVVFTSRLSDEWLRAAKQSRLLQFDYIWDTLEDAGIGDYIDSVTAEKVPAVFYIDDRAIPFEDNWAQIERAIARRGRPSAD
jgi:hypothetical protein